MTVVALCIVFKARTSESIYLYTKEFMHILSNCIVTGPEREKQTFQTINYFCAIKDHSSVKEKVKPNLKK